MDANTALSLILFGLDHLVHLLLKSVNIQFQNNQRIYYVLKFALALIH